MANDRHAGTQLPITVTSSVALYVVDGGVVMLPHCSGVRYTVLLHLMLITQILKPAFILVHRVYFVGTVV